MKNLLVAAMAALPILTSHALAQAPGPRQLIYTQPLEGVYSQDWSAQVLGPRESAAIETYVVGTGKLGDFFGILSVNCEIPDYSEWLATGGFVQWTDIPGEAMQGIIRQACGN